MVVLNNDLFGK